VTNIKHPFSYGTYPLALVLAAEVCPLALFLGGGAVRGGRFLSGLLDSVCGVYKLEKGPNLSRVTVVWLDSSLAVCASICGGSPRNPKPR
jgi:hypothetical protein